MGTVLIFDADLASRRRTISAVRYGGFDPKCAGGLEHARRLLRRNRYDALIVDPGESSEAPGLVEALRAQTDAPIIAVSASVDQPGKIAMLDAGADDFVPQPVDPEELLARVRAVMRRVAHLEDERPIVTRRLHGAPCRPASVPERRHRGGALADGMEDGRGLGAARRSSRDARGTPRERLGTRGSRQDAVLARVHGGNSAKDRARSVSTRGTS